MAGPPMKGTIQQISVNPNASLRDALRAIERGRLGLALLVAPKTGTFEGLVTDGDIRRALLAGAGLESPVLETSRPGSTTAPVGSDLTVLSKMFSEKVRVVPLLDSLGRVADLAIFDRRTRLPVACPSLGEAELQNVSECILTGWISSTGSYVGQFETLFSAYIGTSHAVATCNGTAALHLALSVLGIGPGDEVIVPSLTFISPANAVRYTGATPVFVDVDPETWTIDPEAIEAAVTQRTRAVIPVHLYGHPADMDRIHDVASRYGLYIVEDAAEAHGAMYKGRKVGGLSDIGIFSFFGNKIITTGEGGMLVTDNPRLAERARLLCSHGMSPDRRYWHTELGFNYRMTNLQAAVGVAQMEKIDDLVASHRHTANLYRRALLGISGVSLPTEAPWCTNVFWLYSIQIEPDKYGMGRDSLMRILGQHGVETRVVFPPLHTQPIYANGQKLPVSERIGEQGLSLPSGRATSERDIDRTASLVRGSARRGAA